MSAEGYTFPHEVAAQQRREQVQNELMRDRANPPRHAPGKSALAQMLDDPHLGNPRYWTEAQAEGIAGHVQARADSAFQLRGSAAPPIRAGEHVDSYRRRLLNELKRHSGDPAVANVDMATLPRQAIGAFESLLIDKADAKFREPSGPLRMMVETDQSGRPIRRFFGDPEHCWREFKPAMRRFATGMQTATGARAPGAIFPVGTVMSDGSVR